VIKDKEWGWIPETQEEIDAEMHRYWKARYRHEYWFALGSALKQWCKDEDNWHLNKTQKIFYTAKAVICLLLHLRTSFTYKDDPVDVSIFDYEHIGSCGGAGLPDWYGTFNVLRVGYGYFKGWHYEIINDANA
jgi:hypothetical protein